MWISQLTSLEFFERNHKSYVTVTIDHLQNMDQNIDDWICDFNLLQQVRK